MGRGRNLFSRRALRRPPGSSGGNCVEQQRPKAVGDVRRIRGRRILSGSRSQATERWSRIDVVAKARIRASVRGELHLDIRNGGIMTTLAGESAGELFCRSVELVIRGGSLVSPRGQET